MASRVGGDAVGGIGRRVLRDGRCGRRNPSLPCLAKCGPISHPGRAARRLSRRRRSRVRMDDAPRVGGVRVRAPGMGDNSLGAHHAWRVRRAGPRRDPARIHVPAVRVGDRDDGCRDPAHGVGDRGEGGARGDESHRRASRRYPGHWDHCRDRDALHPPRQSRLRHFVRGCCASWTRRSAISPSGRTKPARWKNDSGWRETYTIRSPKDSRA